MRHDGGMARDYRVYSDLAGWWPLISPPEEYTEEAAHLAAAVRPPSPGARGAGPGQRRRPCRGAPEGPAGPDARRPVRRDAGGLPPAQPGVRARPRGHAHDPAGPHVRRGAGPRRRRLHDDRGRPAAGHRDRVRALPARRDGSVRARLHRGHVPAGHRRRRAAATPAGGRRASASGPGTRTPPTTGSRPSTSSRCAPRTAPSRSCTRPTGWARSAARPGSACSPTPVSAPITAGDPPRPACAAASSLRPPAGRRARLASPRDRRRRSARRSTDDVAGTLGCRELRLRRHVDLRQPVEQIPCAVAGLDCGACPQHCVRVEEHAGRPGASNERTTRGSRSHVAQLGAPAHVPADKISPSSPTQITVTWGLPSASTVLRCAIGPDAIRSRSSCGSSLMA